MGRLADKDKAMAYKGDTVKYRISTNTGTWRTVDSLKAVDSELEKLKEYRHTGWVAVDRIETTRIRQEDLSK